MRIDLSKSAFYVIISAIVLVITVLAVIIAIMFVSHNNAIARTNAAKMNLDAMAINAGLVQKNEGGIAIWAKLNTNNILLER